jgi:hypothetical protein
MGKQDRIAIRTFAASVTADQYLWPDEGHGSGYSSGTPDNALLFFGIRDIREQSKGQNGIGPFWGFLLGAIPQNS